MLNNVHLKNLALIKEAEIDFEKGLNVMTGETGSGKSIIIGSINIALGAKANKGMIRNGADYALVELQFSACEDKVYAALQEADLPLDEDRIAITRKLTAESSTAKINGETVTLATLKKITSLLVDVHGQHEHQSLLDPAKHLDLVDSFAAGDVSEIKERMKAETERYRALRKEAASFSMDEEELRREKELLAHEYQEIESAALVLGEDEQAEAEYKKLAASEQILKTLHRIQSGLEEESGGVIVLLQDSLRRLEDVLSYDAQFAEIKSMLMDLDSVAKDASGALHHASQRHRFDGERFAFLQQRLDLINHLKSRYGKTIPEIKAYAAELSARMDKYEHYTERKQALTQELKQSARALNVLAGELSALRKKAAQQLEPMICTHLSDLNFLDVRFAIDFQKTDKVTANGFDKVEFLISANPGEPLAPLAKVASGGELSRIMLAIKSSMAQEDRIPTLIFDEIDTGISGFTAQKVAEKLNLLAKSHQIICITHLPQIAAMADCHHQIHKAVEDGSTISGIEALSEEQMVAEIAKLVGGAQITEAALAHAKELKEACRACKRA